MVRKRCENWGSFISQKPTMPAAAMHWRLLIAKYSQQSCDSRIKKQEKFKDKQNRSKRRGFSRKRASPEALRGCQVFRYRVWTILG
jgi:hypothetical protein